MWMLWKKIRISQVQVHTSSSVIVCNHDLQKIKKDINDIEERLKNIIDILA
ncbi:hypothetical protein AB205_0029070 [Aquarana catesbeiana]|uniref:Uncharacterized protein n=1 Tax=Aquarana catesbeiana TaxID=8400 RepID=A0A2G9R9B3_AQUCT|nr:hypothetical protein AB205_0029070 [Aquarana catesbeiana]